MLAVLMIPLCLLLFGYLAFKRWSAIIIGPLVTVVLLLFAGLPIFSTLLGPYMTSAGNYFKSYFLVFLSGALFGSVYRETRGAEAIAVAMTRLTKGRFAAPLVMMITGLLTFGGISGFVVLFAVYPIALELFRKANISRRVVPAAVSAGCWTWSMTAPGSPAIQNIIPMRALGTSSVAAPLTGTISAVIEFILIFAWLEYRSRSLARKGEGFDEVPVDQTVTHHHEHLPNPILALLPLLLILFLFNVMRWPVEIAVISGTVLAMIFFWKHGGGRVSSWVTILNKGGHDSAAAILNTALVVGFAGAVKITPGFMRIIEWLKSISLSPLVFVAVTVAIAAGAAGSASGGLGVAFDAMKDTYLALGVSPENIHRVATIAAGTLDTLPHQGVQITLLSICGLSHRQAYGDIAITQILIPFISLALVIPMMALGW